jgi:hypothetical protein
MDRQIEPPTISPDLVAVVSSGGAKVQRRGAMRLDLVPAAGRRRSATRGYLLGPSMLAALPHVAKTTSTWTKTANKTAISN